MDNDQKIPDEENSPHTKTHLRLSGSNVTEDDLTRLENFPYLEQLDLSSSNVRDSWLVHLKHLYHLKVLYLDNTDVSDAGLVYLQQLSKLKLLMLSKTNISDAGTIHLAKLSELILLDLAHTKISDIGLSHLIDLVNLDHLDLNGTKIEGTGLILFKQLLQLKNLYLNHTKIDDAVLVHLKDLPNLKNLSLTHTNISDAGLIHLSELTQLESLKLSNTNVSERGVHRLKNLSHLRSISLYNTNISDSNLASLESLLPNCQFRPDSKSNEISDLSEKANEATSNEEWATAKEYGDRLGELIGEPNVRSLQEEIKKDSTTASHAIWHLGHWITVCESRKDFEKAAQYADVSIIIQRQEIIDSYRKDLFDDEYFKSNLEDLFIEYELQAIRYFNLNKIEHAKNVMSEALELSKRYHVPLDEDQQDLIEEFELE